MLQGHLGKGGLKDTISYRLICESLHTRWYLELLSGRIQRVLHQVWVVAALLQQHENVLELQVDLGVQRTLDLQHWSGAAGAGGGGGGGRYWGQSPDGECRVCVMDYNDPPLLALLADLLQVLLQVVGWVSTLLFVVHHLPSASLWPAAGRHINRSLRLRDRVTILT